MNTFIRSSNIMKLDILTNIVVETLFRLSKIHNDISISFLYHENIRL